MGTMTHVPAILDLAQILRKMLPADMDMCAAHRALHLCPEALHGVRGDAAPDIFADAVIDGVVPVALEIADVLIADEIVGMDFGV